MSHQQNHIGGVMVSMVNLSLLNCGFEHLSGQTKDHKIDICCFKEQERRLIGSDAG
jgi:hypothetical protein